MRVKIHLNTLLLKNKFAISHGVYNHREQLIVEFDAHGLKGFGETVAIDYYGISILQLQKEAEKLIPAIENLSIELSYNVFYSHLLTLLPDNPFLRCAFDCAFIDLQAQLANKSIRSFLGISLNEETESSVTIGLGDSDELIEQRLTESWPIYKVKIDTTDREYLYEKIHNRNKHFGVDANGSLDMGQAQKVSEQLRKYGGLYAEQLLGKEDYKETSQLHKENSDVLLFADESVTNLASAKKLSKFYNGYVLKLTKCGGITPVLDIIRFAKKHDKKLLAGCMTESSIGINNMLALLPLFDYADLDGAFLISNDDEVCAIDKRSKRKLMTNGRFTESKKI